MKTLVIVDDHEMIRVGIQFWLESKTDWKIIGQASSINETLGILEKDLPSTILIDVDLGKENGFDLIPTLKEKYPELKIVMYSMHDQASYIVQAENYGAHGYISKSSNTEEFEKGLNAVYEGGLYLDTRLEDSFDKIKEVSSILSKREFTIFLEMLKGKSNDEISQILDIKKHSVEVCATMIYEKTFCKNRTELLEKYK